MSVTDPEEDFAGFAIERKAPGDADYQPLKNRLAFAYPEGENVDGYRNFSTLEAPIQKFRWIDFPQEIQDGIYSYRVTKIHMPDDGTIVKGTSIELSIPLDPVTYHDFLDIGFTRNFASSQAFRDRMGNPGNINTAGAGLLPKRGTNPLDFKHPKQYQDIYPWLGFEAYTLLFDLLKEAVEDEDITVDMLAYDFDLPEVLEPLVKLGSRLRLVMDNSKGSSPATSHLSPTSAPSLAAAGIQASAGEGHVVRTCFSGLQHHKVIILKKGGKPYKVSCGSTNFSFRGLYIQANNLLVFSDPDIAGLFGEMFDAVFEDPKAFASSPFTKKWHEIPKEGRPKVRACFSPHSDPDLSLKPVGDAIDQAQSSVFYAVAFLSQIAQGGITRDSLDGLMERKIFSYGICDKGAEEGKSGGMEILKPDGTTGLVDFEYLSAHAPEPFKSEWSGGAGVNIHHKFVVVDFNTPNAKVFTGSSNLAPNGERNNGDHLLVIEDQRVATAYAIEALRVFDHLHFRSAMQAVETEAAGQKTPATARKESLKLQKPKKISGAGSNWFDRFYEKDSQYEKDRLLFAE